LISAFDLRLHRPEAIDCRSAIDSAMSSLALRRLRLLVRLLLGDAASRSVIERRDRLDDDAVGVVGDFDFGVFAEPEELPSGVSVGVAVE
jgi:hypothetical protein